MNVTGKTDIGLLRQINQDAFVQDVWDDPGGTAGFAVVCDGMGGANGGEIASGIATRVISSRIRELSPEQRNPESVRRMLTSATMAANAEIFDRAQKSAELEGMGTTVVTVVIVGKTACVSHVGDSRLYLIRDGVMTQVTRDHSVVQEMIERGQLTEEQARSHPRKHFITRALGVTDEEEGEYDELELLPEDKLLLCTDGLTNMVAADRIVELVLNEPRECVTDALVRAALDGGGTDNVTVVLMDVVD